MAKKKNQKRKKHRSPKVRLKKRAWELCSKYIRLRDADEFGIIDCITCSKRVHWKEAQASHLVGGRSNSILFDERGLYASCMPCNIFLHGNILSYVKFMQKQHGHKKANQITDDLIRLSKQAKQFSLNDLQELIESYKMRILELEQVM